MLTRARKIALLSAAALAAGALGAPAAADSDAAVVTITENDLGPAENPGDGAPDSEWYTPDSLNTDGAVSGFVAAPDHDATYGNGSFLFDVPADERAWILTDQYGTGDWHGEPDAKDGTALADITALGYSTFISDEFPDADSTPQEPDVVPSLQIMAFTEPGGDYLGLVYDPPSSAATTGQWQSWDALDNDHAGWRLAWEQGSDAYMTWSDLTAAYPDAVVGWQIGIAAGTWPNKDFHGYTDLLTVGVDGETTVHNFAPFTISKDTCKDDGWREHGFRNQGQCIRYVTTGEDSR